MTVIRTVARAAVLVLAVPTLLLSGAVSASADDAAAARIHHATFAGPISSNGNSGRAGDDPLTVSSEPGWCVDITRQPCQLAWHLVDGLSVCDATPAMGTVGFAEYTTAAMTFAVELEVVKGPGVGVLEGHFSVKDKSGSPAVFQVHIDAGDSCAAAATLATVDAVDVRLGMDIDLSAAAGSAGQFTGYVDYQ